MKKNRIFISILLLLYGCVSVKAPDNWLPEPKDTVKELFGAWITIKVHNEPDALGGEFIAFQNDTVFVFTSNGIVHVERVKAINAEIDLYRRETNKAALWTTLGTLSTISHGFFLIFSAPIWIITGISSAVGASHGGLYEEDYPSNEWFESVKKYSRFPNGLPPNIKLEKLKPKYADNQ